MSISIDDQLALARKSPFGWLSYVMPAWIPYPWLEIVDYHFCRAMDPNDPVKYVALSAPPQHGKSMYSCIGAPSYAAGRWPDKRGLLITHGDDLAVEFGRVCLNTLTTYGPEVWGVELDPASRAKKRWRIKGRRGGLEAAGLRTGISGKTADWCIFDDPFPNYDNAQSLTYRDKVWNFYLNDLRQRLSKDAWIILLQTRWNDDDLIGRIQKGLSADSHRWEFISLPGIAEQDEYHPDKDSSGNHRLFRRKGEALCEDLKPISFLQEQQRTMDPVMFQALIQQNPSRPEGVRWGAELFGPHIWVDKLPDDIYWAVCFLDPALGTDAKGDDYQAITYLGVRGGESTTEFPNDVFYMETDLWRVSVDGMIDRSISFIIDKPRLPIFFRVESTAFQGYLVNPLTKKLKELGLHNDVHLAGQSVDPNVKKEIRIATTLTSYWINRQFRVKRTRGGLQAIDQCKNFGSNSVKKDAPDSMAGAIVAMDELAEQYF